jgi:hypothetical protein
VSRSKSLAFLREKNQFAKNIAGAYKGIGGEESAFLFSLSFGRFSAM